MKTTLILLFLLIYSTSIYAQKRLNMGFVLGIKKEQPNYDDTGNQLRHYQNPRLVVGFQGDLQLTGRFAFQFGVMSNNTGLDINFKNSPLNSFEQGITMVQIPLRLRTKLFGIKNDKIRIEAISGFSYVYNWTLKDDGFTQIGNPSSNGMKYSNYGVKSNIFWLDYGLQWNIHFGAGRRFTFYNSFLWNNAFTPVVETAGQYTIDGKTSDFKVTSKGRAYNFLLGLQYGINTFSSEDRKRIHKIPRRASDLPTPDSVRTIQKFNLYNHWAINLSSPFLFTQSIHNQGVGSLQMIPGPGFMVGLDFYPYIKPNWTINLSAKIGVVHQIFRYQVPANEIKLPSDFVGSGSTDHGFALFNIGIARRQAISRRNFIHYGLGGQMMLNLLNEVDIYTRPNTIDGPFNLIINQDFMHYAQSPLSPYLKAGFGTMLRNGSVLQFDLLYNHGFKQIMQGKYEFYQTGGNQTIGQGTYKSDNRFASLQISYVFNSWRRKTRHDLLK